jgi:hypothetical protein
VLVKLPSSTPPFGRRYIEVSDKHVSMITVD